MKFNHAEVRMLKKILVVMLLLSTTVVFGQSFEEVSTVSMDGRKSDAFLVNNSILCFSCRDTVYYYDTGDFSRMGEVYVDGEVSSLEYNWIYTYASTNRGFVIIDCEDVFDGRAPYNPRFVDRVNLGGITNLSVTSRDSLHVYASGGPNGVFRINIQQDTNPYVTDHLSTPGYANDLCVVDGFVYTACWGPIHKHRLATDSTYGVWSIEGQNVKRIGDLNDGVGVWWASDYQIGALDIWGNLTTWRYYPNSNAVKDVFASDGYTAVLGDSAEYWIWGSEEFDDPDINWSYPDGEHPNRVVVWRNEGEIFSAVLTQENIHFLQFVEENKVSDKGELPQKYEVSVYPNPFNPTTSIGFSLARQGRVTLAVYDVLGRQVATLIDRTMNNGHHTVFFDGSNLSAGAYFLKIRTKDSVHTQKLVLLK